jgi:hypothetical protein
MQNSFIIAAIVSILFFVVKVVEMKYVEKEDKPLKLLLRDTLIVYFSVVCGFFLFEKVNPMINITDAKTGVTQVFTDNPGF